MFASVVHCPTTLGEPTVRVADPLIPPMLALIFDWPGVIPPASPLVVTPATPGTEEFHVTLAVTFSVTPLTYVPIALN